MKIPLSLARKIGLSSDTRVEIKIEGGKLLTIPDKRKWLEELLEQITPENVHSEVDWGKKVGKEEW